MRTGEPTLEGPGSYLRFLLPAVFVGSLFYVTWTRGSGSGEDSGYTDLDETVELSGQIFGTTWMVKAAGVSPDVIPKIEAVLQQVDRQMSTWKPDSELSKLNANPATEAVQLSQPFARVMAEAINISDRSGGAFDVTLGPVINAWGFGPDGVVSEPADDVLVAARARTGTDKLHLEGDSLRRDQGDLFIDLSAIAKGFAVDEVAHLLDAEGLTDHMVEIGGEVRARGLSDRGEPWRLGIEKPNRKGLSMVELVVSLDDMSMATSGNYRNYRLVDGRTISHAMAGRTGQPVAHDLASVTVLHANCMTADAWATALFVLGVEEGRALAEREGLGALFLSPDPQVEGQYIHVTTSAWPQDLD